MAIAKVIIDVSLDKEFDYLIPETLLPQIKVGVMVRVPFGHSTREGYVLSLADSSDYTGGRLKPITGLCCPPRCAAAKSNPESAASTGSPMSPPPKVSSRATAQNRRRRSGWTW